MHEGRSAYVNTIQCSHEYRQKRTVHFLFQILKSKTELFVDVGYSRCLLFLPVVNDEKENNHSEVKHPREEHKRTKENCTNASEVRKKTSRWHEKYLDAVSLISYHRKEFSSAPIQWTHVSQNEEKVLISLKRCPTRPVQSTIRMYSPFSLKMWFLRPWSRVSTS